MLTPAVMRKFMQPGLPPILLHRTPLTELLQNALTGTYHPNQAATYKLILLCTPAGYGKTTLLADFAQQTGFPCCWYTLDHTDIDTYQFISLLLANIRYRFPQCQDRLGPQLDDLLADELRLPAKEQRFEQVIDALITAIHHHISERFAIFFCNYHEVNDNNQINLFMNTLLPQLPEQCTIVIESRAIPSLDLAALLSRRQLLGIGSNILRFTAQDIQELMRLQHFPPISDAEATSIAGAFGGWIAGILLGTRLGDLHVPSQQSAPNVAWGSPAVRTDKQNLFAYLVNEVFRGEVAVYEFLKETSLLQQMTPHFCDALLQISDAEQRLAYIEQKGLFVSRSDNESPSYTFHPILRELFYVEARRQNAAHVQALHCRAANLFFSARVYDQAVYHALAASEFTLATRFVEEAFPHLQLSSHADMIASWIDMMPVETVNHAPRLLLIRANIHLGKSEWILAQPLLKQAHDLVATQNESESDQPLLADILIAQSRILFNAGEYLLVQQLCQQALALLPADRRESRARAFHHLGQASTMLGDAPTGLVQMQQALQLWGHNTQIRETAILHGNLANVYSLIGNYTLAEHHSQRAIAACEQLGDIRSKINNMIGLAITKRNKGELDESVAMLQEGLTMAREVGFMNGEAYALENLGELYQEQGHLEQSLKALEDCLDLAGRLKDTMLINNALCALAMTYLLMGDPQTALFLVDQTEIKTADAASYEGMFSTLTRGTVFLYQHQYQKAYPFLQAVAAALRKAGLKSRYIRALMRLAACQVGLKKLPEAIQTMEQVVTAIKQYSHEHIAAVEFQRFPELLQAIQTMPPTALLEAWYIQPRQRQEGEVAPEPNLSLPGTEHRTLRIFAFGEPVVQINNTPVSHWRMARSLELYFYLLNVGGSVRKEQIIDALWPEPEENIDQTFRSTIYYLRKAVGEVCIIYRSGKYTLDHTPLYGQQVWYDVEIFQSQYAAARQFSEQEDEDSASKSFHEMINLYRDDYLQTFYSDWCIASRDRLRRIYMDARQQLALIAWNHEDLDECIMHWQQLLVIDGCMEKAHYGLMRCYLRQGKRTLALRQYQHCVDTLQQELSIAPGQAIQKLHQRLIGSNG